MKEVVVPPHSAIEALGLQSANPFIDEVASRRQRKFVVRLDSPIFGTAEDAHLPVSYRQVPVLEHARPCFTRRSGGRARGPGRCFTAGRTLGSSSCSGFC